MTRPQARALWLASALLVLGGALPRDAARELARRAPPAAGAARLLYGARLDANREPAAVLEILPGIGRTRAAAIVAGRPYCRAADLDRVSGIGPATVAAIAVSLAFPAPPRDCERQLREESH